MNELKSLYARTIYVNGDLIVNGDMSASSNYGTKLGNYLPESFTHCYLQNKTILPNGTYLAFYKNGNTLVNFGIFMKLANTGNCCSTGKDCSGNVWTLYFDSSGYPCIKQNSSIITAGYLYYKRLDA